MIRIRACVVASCLVWMPRFAAYAQPTNVEAYQTLALRCLGSVPDTTRSLRLAAPAQMPYLRTALADAWRREGRSLFFADSSSHPASSGSPRLAYVIEEARVAYARLRRKRVERTVLLALRYTFTAPDGRLLDEAGCRETFSDTIPRAVRAALEAASFPETQGELPRAGWTRRYLEPAVLAVATAVTVYLFFNLRSDRSGDGS